MTRHEKNDRNMGKKRGGGKENPRRERGVRKICRAQIISLQPPPSVISEPSLRGKIDKRAKISENYQKIIRTLS